MSWWTEPVEEKHANVVGRRGARVVVVQPSPDRVDELRPFRTLFGEVGHGVDPRVALAAWRLSPEMRRRDPLAPLAIESQLMQLLLHASRTAVRRERTPPGWLARARELLHAGFRDGPDLASLARAAGVTPWHVARAFRQHYGSTAGEYARAIRLHWALGQLVESTRPIAEVALAAGFADQSHFTRDCRSTTRCTPREYRRLLRGEAN